MRIHNDNIKNIPGLTCLLLILSGGYALFDRDTFFMGRKGVKTDIIGNKYGKLTVLRISPRKERQYFYECQCECGNTKTVGGAQLKNGTTMSCGCLTYKHGWYGTKLNHVWNGIKQRCSNPKQPAYKNYGGRGIKVCEEWTNSFEAFRDWALANGYVDSKFDIDRIDNDGNYCPENCRWVTRIINCNNKRVSKIVEYHGQKIALALLTRQLGIRDTYKNIWKRLKTGMSLEHALSKPFKNATVK